MDFSGRKIIIATMHRKEEVIAPRLASELGLIPFTDTSFDTDIFGTFTGEVERVKDPLSTLRDKCNQALERSDCDLVIGSEGSFGPHPYLYFSAADDELLLFIDKKNNLEIVERELTTSTNFNSMYVDNLSDLLDFAKRALFPSHHLIISGQNDERSYLQKGIHEQSVLIDCFNECMTHFGGATVETDMRAMCNPTRMQNIALATEKLIRKIKSHCPNCSTPGYSISLTIPGLPCHSCMKPTRSTLYHRYGCSKCGHHDDRYFPYDKEFEDPSHCDFCNP
jgi:hypothetical protein